jgi:cell division protein FtsB
MLKSVLSFVKNKYFIVSVLFVLWMLFFDPKDWGLINNRINKLHDLQESEKHLTQLITETRKELGELKTNAQTIEKYAREKYYMKKDNEDLFIVNSP